MLPIQNLTYAKCYLCEMLPMQNVTNENITYAYLTYAKCYLDAKCYLCEILSMRNVTYAKCYQYEMLPRQSVLYEMIPGKVYYTKCYLCEMLLIRNVTNTKCYLDKYEKVKSRYRYRQFPCLFGHSVDKLKVI